MVKIIEGSGPTPLCFSEAGRFRRTDFLVLDSFLTESPFFLSSP